MLILGLTRLCMLFRDRAVNDFIPCFRFSFYLGSFMSSEAVARLRYRVLENTTQTTPVS